MGVPQGQNVILSYLCFRISFDFSFRIVRMTSVIIGVSKSFFHIPQGGSLGVPQGRNVFLSYLGFQISFNFSFKIMRVTSDAFGVSKSFFPYFPGWVFGYPPGGEMCFCHIYVFKI